MLLIKNLIFFARSLWSEVLNKSPPLPLSKISLGPVGQSLEITNFFNASASNNTFGSPSKVELKMNKLIIISFSLFSVMFSQDCTDGRYIEDIFDVSVQYNIEYGENTNETFIGTDYTQTLYMDVYGPVGDELENRPLIIFMFGRHSSFGKFR